MPDTYTSQFSGEEIDSALRAAQIISGADTPAELREKLEIRGDTIPVSATDPTPVSEALTASGGGVNPNLLDNWYFANPINQRGQTEYTGNNIYCIDRFICYNLNVSTSNSCLKLSSAEYWYSRIGQKIEPYLLNALSGKQVTMTALLKSAKAGQVKISLYDSTDNVSSDTEKIETTTGDVQLVTATFTIPPSYSNHKVEALFYSDYLKNGQETELYALKLELGSTQTLAHKEGDKWVLNEIPDFGEQLRRCQRYFVRLTNAYGYGWTYNSSIANFFVSLPTTMRVNPVIKLTTNGEIQTINGAKSVTGFEAKGIHPNGFAIDLHNSANALITGTPVTWHSSSMDISADL